ncbi:MAG: hypothetical protein H7831_01870 [Magnetococcus sp. WYHC-3]
MTKLWLSALLGLGLALAAGGAEAGPVADEVKMAMGEARQNLVAMVGAADMAEYPQREMAIQAATAKVDATVAAHPQALAAFNAVWMEFKNTRDTQIIPALKAGKVADAKALASGIQAERVKKMNEALSAVAD